MADRSSKPAPRAERPPAPQQNGGSSLDVSALRQIVEILESSEVTRLVWRRGDERLYIRRGGALPPQVTHVHAAAAPPGGAPSGGVSSTATAPASQTAPPPPAAEVERPGYVITSPFVGTFYRSSGPDQPSFVETGSVVRKGQVLCIVEAMKLMNEIESEMEGKVTEVLAENGQPVEFGQPLFRIEKV